MPIAGDARRFTEKGYSRPKPLLKTRGMPIIDWAMESINTKMCNIIFVVKGQHVRDYGIDKELLNRYPDASIVVANSQTDGALSSCLLAEHLIYNAQPLCIFTPDARFVPVFNPTSVPEVADGYTLVHDCDKASGSYCRIDTHGVWRVSEVVEKARPPISRHCNVGVYWFRTGFDFCHAAHNMIANGEWVNGEFYIAPVFNKMIKQGGIVLAKNLDHVDVLGTPQDLEEFESNELHV